MWSVWLVLLAGARVVFTATARFTAPGKPGTWDCRYPRPTARMQCTGSSFGQTLVGLFAFVTWPRRDDPVIRRINAGMVRFGSAVPDLVLDRLVLPVFAMAGRLVPSLRVMQQGQTQVYVWYILATLILIFLLGALGILP